MPRKPYSITKDGRIVVHDAEALKAGMLKALKKIDEITGEDEWEWGDPDRPAELIDPKAQPEGPTGHNGKSA
jgi:hypothetical protein